MSLPSSKMLPLDSNNSFRIVSSILCEDAGMYGSCYLCIQVYICTYRTVMCGYLELCLGFVDVDYEFVSLFLQIRSFQPHHITVYTHTHMSIYIHVHVTPAQLKRPGIGRNTSCALGDCSTSRP